MGWKQIDARRMIWEGTIELDASLPSTINDLTLITKEYATSASTGYVLKSGDTMTGLLTIDRDQSSAQHNNVILAKNQGTIIGSVVPAIVISEVNSAAAVGIIGIDTNNDNLAEKSMIYLNSTDEFSTSSNFKASVLTSSASTGTAPFAVSSTTKVSNLNVDQVDGFDLDQGVSTTNSPTWTGVTAQNTGVAANVNSIVYLNGVTTQGTFNLQSANGTSSSPTSSTINQNLGTYNFKGYRSGFKTGASVTATTTENWSSTGQGTLLTFKVNPTGTTSVISVLSTDGLNTQLLDVNGTGIVNVDVQNTGLGFFGVTPVTQQTTTSQTPATFAANTSGIANDSATWDGYTIGDIVKILRVYGLLA